VFIKENEKTVKRGATSPQPIELMEDKVLIFIFAGQIGSLSGMDPTHTHTHTHTLCRFSFPSNVPYMYMKQEISLNLNTTM